ncbi:single-stranded DNA-binding protein [Marinococcus sp. PL1-022]|uniref:single-stranded DNA-binding protein n=1 Tax=Marinococcus sp. PL1-022 TaxID=3095363 RepID=UPI0029C53AD3|nr:single-stranded DNA-binding protein [Marinococcus sp. PL1-022]MDX6151686.1 single-stranded DNA-binding protein [Marinococcus sp. PL1-022]
MFNQVTLVGRFTRDPELTYTKDGTPVCNFTLAVQRSFRNQEGEYDADFVPVTVWRRQAETTCEYCHKGAMVGVKGRINTRLYDNKDNKRVQVVEVNAEDVRFLKLQTGSSDAPPESIGLNTEPFPAGM